MTRIKFILEDGRKIYMGGEVKRNSGRWGKDIYHPMRARMPVYEYVRVPIISYSDYALPQFKDGDFGAFDPHLLSYYRPQAAKNLSRPHVKVVGIVYEPVELPIDSEAFVLGGALADNVKV